MDRVPMNRAERVLSVAVIAVICAACVIILQKSFHFVGTAPFLNVDDSIPNVAVSLAEHGRYGFLASPTQAYSDAERAHAFFNYGPLYFWVAAALTWLMGPSLVLFRMLHPLGLCAIVVALMLAFRRASLLGPAVFTVVMFDLYLDGHWPIARPDIMVSICGMLFLLSVGAAVERRLARWWFVAGFFAASAVTTHQIAAAMIPAAGVIWAWSLVAERPDGVAFGRRAFATLTPLVAGAAAASLVFLAAIDFRFHDLWTMGTGGIQTNRRPYVAALQDHFYYAWSTLTPQSFRVMLTAFVAAALLVLLSPMLREDRRQRTLAWVMPPLIVATLYPLSLGFYGSTHTGYVILCQVAALWTIAAGLSVVTSWISEASASGRYLALAASCAAAIFVGRADARWLSTSSLWEQRAVGNVSISDYIHQVISRIPERARVWGSLYFGMDAGDRTDLLQFNQIFRMVESDFRLDAFPGIAPDFLALGSYDLDQAAVLTVADVDYGLERFATKFSSFRYRPVRLVSAPPYGGAVDFERVASESVEAEDVPPEVAFNDGTGRQWSSRLSAPLDVPFVETAPVSIDASVFTYHPQVHAETSLVADLPAGAYLVEMALARVDTTHLGFVFATPGRHLYWRSGWTDFPMPGTPYLPGARRAWVLADHLGGPLYLSRFEIGSTPAGAHARDRYAMRVVSVRHVDVALDTTDRVPQLTAPDWTMWKPLDPSVTVAAADGVARVAGTFPPGAPLLESPTITVPAHQRVAVTVPIDVLSGAVKVGVVASGASSLAAPTLMPRHIVFDSGVATQVVIVLINSDKGSDGPLDIRLRPVTLRALIPDTQYVDRLMKCRSPFITLDKSDCER